MVPQMGYNDAVLLSSLLYACIDLQLEWDSFSGCARPIHKWLLVSYASVIVLRLTHWLGSCAMDVLAAGSGGNDLLLNLRHKGALPRTVTNLMWTVGVPFFSLWTLLGTCWLRQVLIDTPQCVPTNIHLWFSVFWILLCYAWIIIHVGLGITAFVLERRIRCAESSLREIEDDDVRERWGQVSHISDFRELTSAIAAVGIGGLKPCEIKCLPCEVASSEQECSICLTDIVPGELVRRLPGCNHTFHRSCIDVWLLRQADCPLCKQKVTRETA